MLAEIGQLPLRPIFSTLAATSAATAGDTKRSIKGS